MTQAETLNILKTGVNVFLTGAAGSGKTHVLREYLACLRGHGIPVGVTASTGIAATHMDGITIHAWTGIGVKDELSEYDIEEIAGKENTAKRIMAAKVLIVDEISMMHHFRLDMINRVLKRVRNSHLPFGGLQIIVCGDFFQLPPISRKIPISLGSNGELFVSDDGEEGNAKFAYHSRAWNEAGFIICYLEEQFRQTDPQYLSILNAVRNAAVTKDIVDLLKTRFLGIASVAPRSVDSEAAVEPTKLYSHNINVDAENERELAKIQGRLFEYEMNGGGNKKLLEGLKKSCLAPETLRLKRRARVMFVKNNFEKGYANGTLGAIDDCGYDSITVRTANGRVRVEKDSWRVEDNGRILAEIEQYPLRLAWAITIHKSQGMSLEAAHIDLSKSFEKGMGYVALSRVRSLSGLHLLGLNDIALEIHDEALRFNKKFHELSARHGAEFAVMSEEEMKKLHGAFLGPELTAGQRMEQKAKSNRRRIFKPKKKKFFLSHY
jgi:hypothetical protein